MYKTVSSTDENANEVGGQTKINPKVQHLAFLERAPPRNVISSVIILRVLAVHITLAFWARRVVKKI